MAWWMWLYIAIASLGIPTIIVLTVWAIRLINEHYDSKTHERKDR